MNIQSIINCPYSISIFVLDIEYRYLIFNEAHRQEIFRGHGRFPKLGDNILDFFRSKYNETFRRILKGESFCETDEGDEGDFWESCWAPYYDESENIIGICCFAQEVTEKIKYQNEIEDQASLLDAILECSPDVSVFAIDLDYKLIAFNKTFAKSIQAINHIDVDLDMSMMSIVDGKELETEKKLFDRIFSGEHVHQMNEWGEHKTQVWSDHLSPIYSKKSRKIIGLSCFGTKVE